LTVIDFEKTSLHGTSGLFILSKSPDAIQTEKIDDLTLNDEVIDDYVFKCYEVINNLADGLNQIRSQGYKIVGYGSAAKGNTLINASNIELDYIVDDNPLKQGLYTPGARIKIVPPSQLEDENEKICIVPLAWNYFTEIKNKCTTLLNTNDVLYVKYFPSFTIVREDNA